MYVLTCYVHSLADSCAANLKLLSSVRIELGSRIRRHGFFGSMLAMPSGSSRLIDLSLLHYSSLVGTTSKSTSCVLFLDVLVTLIMVAGL